MFISNRYIQVYIKETEMNSVVCLNIFNIRNVDFHGEELNLWQVRPQAFTFETTCNIHCPLSIHSVFTRLGN